MWAQQTSPGKDANLEVCTSITARGWRRGATAGLGASKWEPPGGVGLIGFCLVHHKTWEGGAAGAELLPAELGGDVAAAPRGHSSSQTSVSTAVVHACALLGPFCALWHATRSFCPWGHLALLLPSRKVQCCALEVLSRARRPADTARVQWKGLTKN